MSDFYPTNLDDQWAFIRGPARLMIAPISVDFPTRISNIIYTTGSLLYRHNPDWTDVGATKGGIQISTQMSGEAWGIDPNSGALSADPTGWQASVSTSLAELTYDNLQIAWETTAAGQNQDSEEIVHYGQATRLTQRRLAILHKVDRTNLIRATVFRKVQLDFAESSVMYNKTGEQQTLAVKFKAIPDTTIMRTQSRFFSIFEQNVDPNDHHVDDGGGGSDTGDNLLTQGGDPILLQSGDNLEI